MKGAYIRPSPARTIMAKPPQERGHLGLHLTGSLHVRSSENGQTQDGILHACSLAGSAFELE